MTNDQVVRTWISSQQNPFIQAVQERYQKKVNDQYMKVCTKEKMFKIADMLLRWGADPNFRHDINGLKGYTPLMLAAEKNNLELFKLMIENQRKPGNPNLKALFMPGDNLYPEASCWEIAQDWGSYDIIKYLDENKDRFK
jgi:ankyrin repeat protein